MSMPACDGDKGGDRLSWVVLGDEESNWDREKEER